MSNTKQASEDEMRENIDALLERWRNILTHKGDGNGDEYYQSEVVDDIQELIRSEKLKLLAEVRERVIGENLPPDVATDSGLDYSFQQFAINMGKAGQRTKLTKLEEEL